MFKREHFSKDGKNKRCSFCGQKTDRYEVITLSKSVTLIGCDSCTGYSTYTHWGNENTKGFYPKYLKQTDGCGLDLYRDCEIPQKIFEYMKDNFWVCARIGKEVDEISHWMMSKEIPSQKPRRGSEWRRPNLFEATQRYVYSLQYPEAFKNIARPWVQCSQNIIPWHEPRCRDYKGFWQQVKIKEVMEVRAKERTKQRIEQGTVITEKDKLSDEQYAQLQVYGQVQAGELEVIENTDGTITLLYK